MKKNKTKLLILSLLSLATVTTAVVVGVKKPHTAPSIVAGSPYTFSFDYHQKMSATEASAKTFVRNTEQGSPITLNVSNAVASSSNILAKLNKSGYMRSATPIHGMLSITVNAKGLPFSIGVGYNEGEIIRSESFTPTEQGNYTFNVTGSETYFTIQTLSESSDVTNIYGLTVQYECADRELPTYIEEPELGKPMKVKEIADDMLNMYWSTKYDWTYLTHALAYDSSYKFIKFTYSSTEKHNVGLHYGDYLMKKDLVGDVVEYVALPSGLTSSTFALTYYIDAGAVTSGNINFKTELVAEAPAIKPSVGAFVDDYSHAFTLEAADDGFTKVTWANKGDGYAKFETLITGRTASYSTMKVTIKSEEAHKVGIWYSSAHWAGDENCLKDHAFVNIGETVWNVDVSSMAASFELRFFVNAPTTGDSGTFLIKVEF